VGYAAQLQHCFAEHWLCQEALWRKRLLNPSVVIPPGVVVPAFEHLGYQPNLEDSLGRQQLKNGLLFQPLSWKQLQAVRAMNFQLQRLARRNANGSHADYTLLSPEGTKSTAWSEPTLQMPLAEMDQWSCPLILFFGAKESS